MSISKQLLQLNINNYSKEILSFKIVYWKNWIKRTKLKATKIDFFKPINGVKRVVNTLGMSGFGEYSNEYTAWLPKKELLRLSSITLEKKLESKLKMILKAKGWFWNISKNQIVWESLGRKNQGLLTSSCEVLAHDFNYIKLKKIA